MQRQPHLLNFFRFRLTEIGRHLQQTDTFQLTPKCVWPRTHFGVLRLRAQRMCLMAANTVLLSLTAANSSRYPKSLSWTISGNRHLLFCVISLCAHSCSYLALAFCSAAPIGDRMRVRVGPGLSD